jgi:hypothetical protein
MFVYICVSLIKREPLQLRRAYRVISPRYDADKTHMARPVHRLRQRQQEEEGQG